MIVPGIYCDINIEDYHAGDGLSSSDMKLLSQSPLHYLTAKRNKTLNETDCVRLGTAAHCAILEPHRFRETYVKAPEGDKRSKVVKDAWAAIEADGKLPLSAAEFETIQGMKDAVMAHPLAGHWLTGGIAEVSGYWNQHVRDDGLNLDGDILCKCRPDYIKELNGQYVIIDLKTTVSSKPDYFSRKAYWDYQYHISVAHYLTGMEAIKGVRAQGFIFVTVEKTPPYAVNVFMASEEFIRAGEETNKELYKLFASCKASDNWPGYPVETIELRLPRGAKQD